MNVRRFVHMWTANYVLEFVLYLIYINFVAPDSNIAFCGCSRAQWQGKTKSGKECCDKFSNLYESPLATISF